MTPHHARCILIPGSSVRAWLCAGGFHEQAQLHKTLSNLKPVFRSVPHVPREAVKVLGTIAEGSFGEVSLAKTQQFGELAVKWLKVRLSPLRRNGAGGYVLTGVWKSLVLVSQAPAWHLLPGVALRCALQGCSMQAAVGRAKLGACQWLLPNAPTLHAVPAVTQPQPRHHKFPDARCHRAVPSWAHLALNHSHAQQAEHIKQTGSRERTCVQCGKYERHLEHFWQEADLLAQLNHPNVLRLYGVVTVSQQDPSVVGIMTEYVRGGSLSANLR